MAGRVGRDAERGRRGRCDVRQAGGGRGAVSWASMEVVMRVGGHSPRAQGDDHPVRQVQRRARPQLQRSSFHPHSQLISPRPGASTASSPGQPASTDSRAAPSSRPDAPRPGYQTESCTAVSAAINGRVSPTGWVRDGQLISARGASEMRETHLRLSQELGHRVVRGRHPTVVWMRVAVECVVFAAARVAPQVTAQM